MYIRRAPARVRNAKSRYCRVDGDNVCDSAPEYLVIGHITRDLIPGGWRLGGTATFSALTASRLGLSVAVLTSSHTPPELGQYPRVHVVNVPAIQDTVFENIYTPSGRIQYLRSVASVITPAELPAAWKQVPIVHLGPVAQEVSPLFLEEFPSSLLGLTPQGWLRGWDGTGRVFPMPLSQAEALLAKASCVILSLEDLGGNQHILDAMAGMTRLLVETRGIEGSVVYEQGKKTIVPAFEVHEVDPTGAGDVFATAFLIRYHEVNEPVAAAEFGNCVASFVIEGPGTSTIPDRDQVEKRLRTGKLRKLN